MMNSGKPAIGRRQGVQPAGRQQDQFPPQRLLGMQFGEVALIAYSDERGNRHNTMVFFFNGKPYLDAKGEEWVKTQLNPAVGWLDAQLTAEYQRHAAPPADLPAGPIDTGVDVLDTPPTEAKAQA